MSSDLTMTLDLNLTLAELRERKRLMDDVWLLALFILFLGIAVPWYLRLLPIDFAPVAWSLFGFGLFYRAMSSVANRLSSGRPLLMLLASVQAVGVLFLGLVWHLTGSVHNPIFLLAFVLPVVASSLVLMRWHSYAIVLLALATVIVVSLVNAPELRWYATQSGSVAQWFAELLPDASASVGPFPGLNISPSYLFVLLGLFAALLLMMALASESIVAIVARLTSQLHTMSQTLHGARDLSSDVLRFSPIPAVLVYADTMKIAQASQSFLEKLFATAGSLDTDLFSVVNFAHPETIRELICGDGGEVPIAILHVHSDVRVACVRIHSIQHAGRRCAYVSLEDITEAHHLKGGLEANDNATIIISAARQIVQFNSAALAIFGDIQTGLSAEIALAQVNLPKGWWELGIRTRQERQFEIQGKRFLATCIATPILSERDTFTVLIIRELRGTQ